MSDFNKIFIFFFIVYLVGSLGYYASCEEEHKKSFMRKNSFLTIYILYIFGLINTVFGNDFSDNFILFLRIIYWVFVGFSIISLMLTLAITNNLMKFIKNFILLDNYKFNKLNPLEKINEFQGKSSHYFAWLLFAVLGFCAGFKYESYIYFFSNILTCFLISYMKKQIINDEIKNII